MSLPNEVSATLTPWGWREGRCGEQGREDISPASSACHAGCLDQPLSPVSSDSAICGVRLQNHLQEFRLWKFPGERLDVQH